MRNNLLALLATFALLFGCKEENKADTTQPEATDSNEPETETTTFTDERDGKVYKYVEIGAQTWMAKNLNYETEGSKCYKNKAEYCKKYGRLYDWKTAMKVCPKGWHLPSNVEWNLLLKYADSSYDMRFSYVAGKYLKTKSGWNDYEGKSGNGDDTYGFAALPGRLSNGIFTAVGNMGFWWSTTDYDEDRAYSNSMNSENEYAFLGHGPMTNLLSVRCVRD